MWEEKNCCTPQKFLGREGMWPGCTPHKKESKESIITELLLSVLDKTGPQRFLVGLIGQITTKDGTTGIVFLGDPIDAHKTVAAAIATSALDGKGCIV